MEKFAKAKIQNFNLIKGGTCSVPNGGSSCSTGGGSKTILTQNGYLTYTWTSDTDIYDSGGFITVTDDNGVWGIQ